MSLRTPSVLSMYLPTSEARLHHSFDSPKADTVLQSIRDVAFTQGRCKGPEKKVTLHTAEQSSISICSLSPRPGVLLWEPAASPSSAHASFSPTWPLKISNYLALSPSCLNSLKTESVRLVLEESRNSCGYWGGPSQSIILCQVPDGPDLRWRQSSARSVGTGLRFGISICSWASVVWSCLPGCRAVAASRSSRASHALSNHCPHNLSVPVQPFWFSLSDQYAIHYRRSLVLEYTVGFALEDFAQL